MAQKRNRYRAIYSILLDDGRMAQKRNRYRAIYSILLDDGGFQELTAPARHLFLTLKISRFNNLAGIFLFGPGEKLTTYKYFMGISEKAFNRAFKELQDTHWKMKSKNLG
jgi:hypothetical protein